MAVTVNFKNYDGTVLQTLSVESGETPAYTGNTPEKPKDTRTRYEFSGWDPAVGPVTEDTDYTAQYTSIPFSMVSFLNYDNSVISIAEYDVGTLAADVVVPADPEKPSTQQYHYDFDGWNPVVHDVGDTDETYHPVFEPVVNQYGVTFVDEDGETVLKAETDYDYGTAFSSVVQPEVPDKLIDDDPSNVRRFSGWDPEPTDVVDDVTYQAVYEVDPANVYTVKFVDENGYVLEEKKCFEGSTPAFDCPEGFIASYDPSVETVTEDATYEVTLTKIYEILKRKDAMGQGYNRAQFLVAEGYDTDDLPDWAAVGSTALIEGDEASYYYKSVGGTWVECADTWIYLLNFGD